MPISQRLDGRDHNPYGFTVWMAGGGVKGGTVVGATDHFGTRRSRTESRCMTSATILHLMGLNHEKLTYRYNGRDAVTDVHGNVMTEVLAEGYRVHADTHAAHLLAAYRTHDRDEQGRARKSEGDGDLRRLTGRPGSVSKVLIGYPHGGWIAMATSFDGVKLGERLSILGQSYLGDRSSRASWVTVGRHRSRPDGNDTRLSRTTRRWRSGGFEDS
ncbi:MAG: DUF1501 domain-containing protein [Bryobacterales bacterium]